jgi:hypothetical protein
VGKENTPNFQKRKLGVFLFFLILGFNPYGNVFKLRPVEASKAFFAAKMTARIRV